MGKDTSGGAGNDDVHAGKDSAMHGENDVTSMTDRR